MSQSQYRQLCNNHNHNADVKYGEEESYGNDDDDDDDNDDDDDDNGKKNCRLRCIGGQRKHIDDHSQHK